MGVKVFLSKRMHHVFLLFFQGVLLLLLLLFWPHVKRIEKIHPLLKYCQEFVNLNWLVICVWNGRYQFRMCAPFQRICHMYHTFEIAHSTDWQLSRLDCQFWQMKGALSADQKNAGSGTTYARSSPEVCKGYWPGTSSHVQYRQTDMVWKHGLTIRTVWQTETVWKNSLTILTVWQIVKTISVRIQSENCISLWGIECVTWATGERFDDPYGLYRS